MAKYTVELRHVIKNINIFEGCDFYTDNDVIRKCFEKKFIEYYYLHEIGFETIGRFKQRLQARLNLKMPYYKQLYITEIESKEINFLLNKDLKETLEREIIGNMESLSNISTTDFNDVDFLESSIDNGNASLDLTKDNLTTVSKNSSKNDLNAKNSSKDNTKQKEILNTTSQGNIGVTSSATLLSMWREVLINIDEMIIEDCCDLFMQIY